MTATAPGVHGLYLKLLLRTAPTRLFKIVMTQPWYMQLLQDWIAGVELSHGRVLEVGCGPGLLTVTLQRPGNTVCAADRSAAMLDSARALVRQRGLSIELFQTDMVTDCPFAENSFEQVVASSVLNVVNNRLEFLCALCGVIKPGGSLSLLVPTLQLDESHAAEYARRQRFGRMPRAVLLTWSRVSKKMAAEELCSLLQSAGFADVKSTLYLDAMVCGATASKPRTDK
jgi:2-polyprenyl-3-methyl-5-hydroxy-6-metoxy-1,4-benzoquinol methylase